MARSSTPIVWPSGVSAGRYPPGSVNIVDCQGQALDFRNVPDEDPQDSTFIALQCVWILGDVSHTTVQKLFVFDGSVHSPCNVRFPAGL